MISCARDLIVRTRADVKASIHTALIHRSPDSGSWTPLPPPPHARARFPVCRYHFAPRTRKLPPLPHKGYRTRLSLSLGVEGARPWMTEPAPPRLPPEAREAHKSPAQPRLPQLAAAAAAGAAVTAAPGVRTRGTCPSNCELTFSWDRGDGASRQRRAPAAPLALDSSSSAEHPQQRVLLRRT